MPVVFRFNGKVPEDADLSQVCLRYTATGSNERNDMLIGLNVKSVLERVPFARFSTALNLARSAGRLYLTSSDPEANPALEYNYLSDPSDLARVREGVRLAVQLAQDPALRDIIGGLVSPTETELASDQALDQWLLSHIATFFHSSGTCKMGPTSDPMAVVDQHCHVHGLEGLRVVDASTMPDVVRANTNATTIMMAERVADLVQQG